MDSHFLERISQVANTRVRRECLDHLLILNESQLHLVLKAYVAYFNHARPHQGLGQQIPEPKAAPSPLFEQIIYSLEHLERNSCLSFFGAGNERKSFSFNDAAPSYSLAEVENLSP